MQGTEDTDLYTLPARPLQHSPGGAAEQVVEQGPVVVEEGPQQVWYGKGVCCHSQSGRTCCCSAIHCSVDFMPQALQAFDLQLWQKKRKCVQSGEAQQ